MSGQLFGGEYAASGQLVRGEDAASGQLVGGEDAAAGQLDATWRNLIEEEAAMFHPRMSGHL